MAQELKITRENDSEIPDFATFNNVDDDGEMMICVSRDGKELFTYINKEDAESIVSYLKQQFKL